MDDNLPLSSPDRPIEVADVMNTEWTDKKHSSFLSSMEASFVNELYRSEYHSKDLLGWLSRTQTYTQKSGSEPENRTFGQFKVLRMDSREEVKFVSIKSEDDLKKESHPLSENLWIQHFRPHFISKETHLSTANEMDSNKLFYHSIHSRSQKHESEGIRSKHTLPSTSHKYHQESVGSMTEVSDQNFVDPEIERGDTLKARYAKKRSRPASRRTKAQVVPLIMAQTLDAETKASDEECSNKNLRVMVEPFQVEPGLSRIKSDR